MSLYQDFNNWLKRSLQPSEPETFVEGGATHQNRRFTTDRDRDQLEDYERVYQQGGPIAQLVDTRAYMTFGTGAEFTTPDGDEMAVLRDGDEITPAEWLHTQFPNLANLLVRLGRDNYIYGDAMAELVETRGGGFDRLELINPKTLTPVWNDKGTIERWEQTIERRGRSTLTQTFDADDIIHIALNRLGRHPLGTSLIGRNWDEVQRFADNQDAIANALEMHAFTKWQVIVGNENGPPIDDNEIRRVRQRFNRIRNDDTYITGTDIDVEPLDTGGIGQGISDITENDLTNLAAGFGVPEEMAGLGRGSTEATAKVRLQAFERTARGEQRALADQFIEEVVRPILDQYSPWPPDIELDLTFGDVVSDQKAVSEWLLNHRESYTHNEVREKLGDGPVDEDAEIDGMGQAVETKQRIQTGDGGGGSGDDSGGVSIDEEAADLVQKIGNWLTVDEAREIMGLPPSDDPEVSDEFGAPGRIGEKQADAQVGGEESPSLFEQSGVTDSRELNNPEVMEWERVYHDVIERVLWSDETDRMLFEFDPEEVPEFVMENLREAVRDGALFEDFETIPSGAADDIADALLDSLDDSHGWSIQSMIGNLQEEVPSLEDHEAERIARTETQALVNKAREAGYEERLDLDEETFDWVGPDDNRTTEVCTWIKDQIPEEGVSLEELKELIQEGNSRFVDHDAREFTPHIQCRHDYVRIV